MSQSYVKSLFDYEEDTGILYWKYNGEPVGSINSNGYVVFYLDGTPNYVHRVIWLWYYGYSPENFIDHKDRVRHNNKIVNLREISQRCNMRNAGMLSSNKSGVKGVFWRAKNSRWQVQITTEEGQKHLGYYTSFNEAVCARYAAEQCLLWELCDCMSTASIYVKTIQRNQ